MLKAIFWDNDGVLVDTEKWFFEANKQIFSNYGFDIDRQNFIEYFLKKNTGTWHWLSESGVSEPDILLIRKERDVMHSQFIADNDIAIQGIYETLSTLDADFRMAVVTSASKKHFEQIHERTELLPFFEFIICGDDCQRTKPDPQPYLLAMQQANLAPEECLVIEDSPRGLAAAIAAGIPCCVIPTELTKGEEFVGAERVLSSADDLIGLLAH